MSIYGKFLSVLSVQGGVNYELRQVELTIDTKTTL